MLPFALIGTILAIVGVRERRGSPLSVTILIGNAATLLLSVSQLIRVIRGLSELESF